ncbi:MAG: mitomycin antibiotics/polyketide fumonisin biosynthesis protein [Gemmatimonadetes bacterium]|nr:mitomycin antibiotics/polyketide fumonisin biosynthesis protein [Gemmatimonadota bacterium]MYB71617.1 mitomycin antibiotics/polyketide fumonisin biosynthesis protein [Gemmatimonadota bacterium]
MDAEQRFAFDTWGFLAVEDAITPEQIADLKTTVDAKGPELHSQHADRGGFWSQTFVDLLDVPVISEILAEIYGGQRPGELPPFRIDHINVHTHGTFNKNLAGGTIHGGNGRLLDPNRPHELVTHYFERDPASGTFSNGLVTVAYELEDTVCNGGGFGCLAGSHKGHYPVPEAWIDLSKGVHPMVTRVPARAGTAIIFTEALCHVTLPWTAPSTRTTLFYKYTPCGEAYSGPDNFFSPTDADQWQGIDERKRAILTPPPQEFIERKAALAKKKSAYPT